MNEKRRVEIYRDPFSHSVEREINIVEAFHEEIAGDPFRIAESHLNRRITEINTLEDVPKLCGDIVAKSPSREEKEKTFSGIDFVRSYVRVMPGKTKNNQM